MQTATSLFKPCPLGIYIMAAAYVLAGIYLLINLAGSTPALVIALLLDVALLGTAYGLLQHHYHGWLAALGFQGLFVLIMGATFAIVLLNFAVTPSNIAAVCAVGVSLFFSLWVFDYLRSDKIKQLYGVAW